MATSAATGGNDKQSVKALRNAAYQLYIAEDSTGLEQLVREATRIEEFGGRKVRGKAKAAREVAEAYLLTLERRTSERAEVASPESEDDTVRANVSPVSLGLALVGALIMLIAIFLPRVESKGVFTTVADNTLIQSGGGWWFVGIALAVASSGWYAYRSAKRAGGTMVLGLIAIGVAVYYGKSHGSLTLCPIGATEFSDACETASPGVGLYAAGVGGLLAAIGGYGIWRSPELDEEIVEVDDEPMSSDSMDDLASRFRVLEQLRSQELITEDEYTSRRAELLKRL
jgi:hypothetical protein